MNRGIGLVLGIMDAGKGSRVWERREGIMNFGKLEKCMQGNLNIVIFFPIFILLSFSLFNFPSLVPLCLR